MSLFEWLWERKNLHPIGEIKDREKPKKGEPINWLFLIFGQMLFWFIFYQLLNSEFFMEKSFNLKLIFGGAFLIYLIVGYKLDIQPDYDNMGWLGGVFDNPFRYSDDMNRFLIFFKILFYPGFLMAGSFVEFKKLMFK